MSGSRAVKAYEYGACKTESAKIVTMCLQNGIRENSYYYWLRIIREEALCEAENKSGALVRVEPEELVVGAVSPQPSSGGIVIRANGVEAEFPLDTDIGILAAFVKALGHA